MNEHGVSDPGLDRVAKRLDSARPVPSADFEASLRRELVEAGRRARRRTRLLVAVCGALGLVLLVLPAIGLAGAGPFATG